MKVAPLTGALERQTMEVLWEHGPQEVKQVYDRLGRKRGITLNTIQSTLKRLYEKGLLAREKVSHAHVYIPAMNRGEYQQHTLEAVIDDLSHGHFADAISTFVDITERAGREELEQLERLVRERLDQRTNP